MPSKILIVEDNVTNQKVISWLLESMDIKCDVVACGEAVLPALEKNQYHLIFMDLRLPGMDGNATTEQIRKAGFTLPIIATSANDFYDSNAGCIEAGMDGYLMKPFTRGDLEGMLSRFRPAPSETEEKPL